MKKIVMVCSFATASLLIATQCNGFELVTKDECLREQQVGQRAEGSESFTPKSAPVLGAPKIEVKSPKLDGTATAPVTIEVGFFPQDGSKIQVDTLRVFYGSLKIDITDRLLAKAKVSPTGIRLEDANIPVGSHKLTIRIADDRQREADLLIRLAIVDKTN